MERVITEIPNVTLVKSIVNLDGQDIEVYHYPNISLNEINGIARKIISTNHFLTDPNVIRNLESRKLTPETFIQQRTLELIEELKSGKYDVNLHSSVLQPLIDQAVSKNLYENAKDK